MKLPRLFGRAVLAVRTARFSALSLPKAIKSEADYDNLDYRDMLIQFDNARSEQHILDAFEDWGEELNEKALCVLTDSIIDKHIVLGPRFTNTCAPVIAHYLGLMTRDSSHSFGYMVQNLAQMGVSSERLWSTIFAKFETEHMEQYIPVAILNRLFVHLSAWKSPPPALLRRVFDELVKFAGRLPGEEFELLQQVMHEREAKLAPLLGGAVHAPLNQGQATAPSLEDH